MKAESRSSLVSTTYLARFCWTKHGNINCSYVSNNIPRRRLLDQAPKTFKLYTYLDTLYIMSSPHPQDKMSTDLDSSQKIISKPGLQYPELFFSFRLGKCEMINSCEMLQPWSLNQLTTSFRVLVPIRSAFIIQD